MFFIFVFFWVATAPADEEARSIERQVFVHLKEEEEPKVVDGVAFGGGSVLLYQNRNSRAT